ncbi:extracellular solute-binding protein [Paenibacillus eucommiae]|uniref:Aldouronate transport system substrate-binding protein n=1 Tax=Paenibacillus eucommiae TaxID=1355755 RepID=A0ABS4IZZ8_9BACL|nr:extracellular solute-binding protein [Paenibacillus eucommiae]MBP1993159.1 putative aldouronate transport system substrate-binding protein [Paenibacillus eucommiae]
MRKKRTVTAVMLAVLLLSVVVAGCSGNKPPAPSASAGAASSSASPKAEEKKLNMKMFMSNSGLAYPDGVDPSSNPYINIVEEYANVDLDLEVPSYTDFQTKFNLMLSSGNLPDIVHSPYPNETEQRADEGAFIDLKAYYDKSPVVQKFISPKMMEMAKSASGHNYRIPMSYATRQQGDGVIVRYDLVVKYNNGKMPETVEEWIELARKIKKAEPDSLPLTNRVIDDQAISYAGLPIFYWYGAQPYMYRVEGGKVVDNFTLPEYKAAVQVMKQLYDEGILDKEFATTDSEKYRDKLKNRNVLLNVNSADQLIPNGLPKEAGTENQEKQFAPPLKQYPSVLKDSKYAQPKSLYLIGGDSLYISAKTKDKDRAWKVIEGFATDKLHEAIFWGFEGEDFKVENGQKTPIEGQGMSNKDRVYKLQLGLIFGFYDGKEANIAAAEKAMDKDEFTRRIDSLKQVEDSAKQNGLALGDFVTLSPEMSAKKTEANRFVSQATIEAIMGKITMDQFDQKVGEYKKKFGFIYDEYTKYMNENKDKLRQLGVNEVDW